MMSLLKDRALFRRFMARNIDYMLWMAVLNIVNYTVLKIYDPVSMVMFVGIGVGLFFIPETLLLYFFKTTPGKLALGIKLTMDFSLINCLKRSVLVNGLGMFFGLTFLAPLVWLINIWYYNKNKNTLWDKAMGANLVSEDISIIQVIVMVGLLFLLGQIPRLIPTPESLPVKEGSLVNPVHDEKNLPKVDTFFFKEKHSYSVYSESCVKGAMSYSEENKGDLSLEQVGEYCFETLSRQKVKEFNPQVSQTTACAIGVSYAIMKIAENKKEKIPKEVTDSQEKFYVDFCEKRVK